MIGVTTANKPKILLPYPHPGQQHVLTHAQRFNWLAAGRRWRKTTLGLHLITEGCLAGGQFIVGAPTYDQVRITFAEFTRAWGGVATFNQSRMTAELGPGKVFFRSLDKADNVRGYSADGVIIDEAGFIKADVWLEVLRPMLLDTGGWLWAKGTPNGRNWFYQEYTKASDQGDAITWQIPTLGVAVQDGQLTRQPHPYENPNVPFDEIQRIWQSTPERIFRQEYLAEFIDDAGGIFRNVRAIARAPRLDKPKDGAYYVAGVDVASLVDWTAISVMDIDTRKQVHTDRFQRVDYPILEQRIQSMYELWRPMTLMIENNSIGQPVIDHLHSRGIPVQGFNTSSRTKTPLIQNLAASIEHQDIELLMDDENQIQELQSYEAKRSASGGWSYSAPDGMHDDTVIALALSNLALGSRLEAVENPFFA